MDSFKKTINGRTYAFKPKGADASSLDLYFQMLSLLGPLLGSVADSVVAPLLSSGDISGAMSGEDGARGRLMAAIPKVLAAAAKASSFAHAGRALGGLASEPKFRDLVLRLFESGLAVDIETPDGPKPQNLGPAWSSHFGRHLGDFIPAAYWILMVNYRGAFTEAFGGLLTRTGLPEAATRSA